MGDLSEHRIQICERRETDIEDTLTESHSQDTNVWSGSSN